MSEMLAAVNGARPPGDPAGPAALAARYADVVRPFLQPGRPYALVDFPNHPNIGDSAIYAGEMAFFDIHAGRGPNYVADLETYHRDIDAYCPEGPIFLHGGGNFGDIWPRHDRLRHDVMAHYKGRKIVQLPQSIHYRDPANRDATARAIAAHGDVTLLVRDHPSFEDASRHFDCEVLLCPDAAHCLGARPAGPAGHAVLSLLRRDPESRKTDIASVLARYGPVVDWPSQFWRKTPLLSVLNRAMIAEPAGLRMPMAYRAWLFRARSERFVKNGFRLLQTGKLIVTDRLHAHILSSLLGLRHVVLDNVYGKIARYLDAWGTDPTVIRLGDGDDLTMVIEREMEKSR